MFREICLQITARHGRLIIFIETLGYGSSSKEAKPWSILSFLIWVLRKEADLLSKLKWISKILIMLPNPFAKLGPQPKGGKRGDIFAEKRMDLNDCVIAKILWNFEIKHHSYSMIIQLFSITSILVVLQDETDIPIFILCSRKRLVRLTRYKWSDLKPTLNSNFSLQTTRELKYSRRNSSRQCRARFRQSCGNHRKIGFCSQSTNTYS